MSIVEFDGPPSWSLDASKTGKSTKWLWVEVVGSSTTPTHEQFELSPVSLAPRYQDGELNIRHLQSHGKIGNCEQSRTFFSAMITLHLYWFKLFIQLLDCVFGCFNLSLCFSHFIGYLSNAVKTIITHTLLKWSLYLLKCSQYTCLM